MKKSTKKLLSILLSLVLFLTAIPISFYSYAAVDDFTKGYDFQIYYTDSDGNFVEVTDQVQVMEKDYIQLHACLIYEDGTMWDITNSGMPSGMENYTLDWSSDARYLAFCEKNDGNFRGYDATKGEAIRNWINNEVATIPVVGSTLAKSILALLDNDVTDIDDLDTEDVIKIVDTALDTMNLGDYKEQLNTSIAKYLNNFDVGITATLKDENGKKVASDTIRLLVLKSDALLSDVVPNAAFIKNHDSIPTTVAVGYETDLDGIITPVRTHYNCEWTVTDKYGVTTSTNATVDDDGHFTANKVGEVQIKVSPDVKGLTAKLTEAFNNLGKLGDTVDSDTMAKALLLILGIKSDSDNYTTLVTIVKAVLDSGVDVDGILSFTEGNMTPLVNFILYVIYQDSITINIVDPEDIPITSFELDGEYSLKEGETSDLKFKNVKPDGAVANNYDISIKNTDVAVMVDDLKLMGIDGSTWNNNYITPNKTTLTCNMDGLSKTYDISVYGKDNKKVVYINIGCDSYVEVNTPTSVNATTFPKRITPSLSYGWLNKDGTYTMATTDSPAYTEDLQAYVTADGVIYCTGCTQSTLAVKEKNGAIATKDLVCGVLTTGVEFTKKHFWTKCDSGIITTGIRGAVCEVSANILPADSSFNELTFTTDDAETVILSSTPLTTAQYAEAALTKTTRAKHASAVATCDEDGKATVYAYAIGNTSCYANISVKTQTGDFTAKSTVAFANVQVKSVDVVADEKDTLIDDHYYQVNAGDTLNFKSNIVMSETGSWKDQGFEDVEWSVDNTELARIADNGLFTSYDVGVVTVKAVSVFGEIEGTATVKILPDYRELKAAMADSDYENLDPYDWSDASWKVFNDYYQEAVAKLADNSFTSQRQVDELAANIRSSFAGLVRYMPLTDLKISCSDDKDNNGFASISVDLLSSYTSKSTTIKAEVYPLEAKDYTVTYKSSNTDKITVSDKGVCKPVSSTEAAYAKITVSVTDPKKGTKFTKDMYVSFAKYPVSSVSVDPTNINFVGLGDEAEKTSETIEASYKSSGTLTTPSIKKGFFVSSDTKVAKVTSGGVVTPVNIGKCTITFYSYDGGHTATTTVNVTTNKTKLKTALDKANALVEDFYTEESYANMVSLRTTANSIYNSDTATQQEVNDITAKLNTAINNLAKNPYANIYITATTGGYVEYNSVKYTGSKNKVNLLIEDNVTLKAVADEGYRFVAYKNSKGEVISTKATDTFSIDYSAEFTAVFEKVVYPTSIKVLTEGKDVNYYTDTVSVFSSYTSASIKLTSEVAPANANFYTVTYSTTSKAVKVSSDGKVTPAENETCYAVIDATVTNNITQEKFKDSVTVAFVKYALKSVSASPETLTFNGIKATQQISIEYSASSSVYTPSLKSGFYTSSNTKIATVDSKGVVTAKDMGTCTITFTSYDGGHTDTVKVTVYADKSSLKSAIDSGDKLEERNYTPDTYEIVQEKLANAKTVYNKEFATQQEVDTATTELTTAINGLEKLDMVDCNFVVDGNGFVEYKDETFDKTNTYSIKVGTSITLKATAKTDVEFVGWYDKDNNLLSDNATYTTTIKEACDIKAKFKDLVFVSKVTATYDSKEQDFVTKSVGLVENYTSNSIDIGCNVYPKDSSHYTVKYTLSSDSNNLTISNATVKPKSNDPAYGKVIATVTDNCNNKTYTDEITVAFARHKLDGVTAKTTTFNFYGEKSASQEGKFTYKSSSSVTDASVCKGFVTIKDSNIAKVEIKNSSDEDYLVISPKAIGSTTVTFTSYDGGHSQTMTINVYADKTALAQSIKEASALNEDDYTVESYSPIVDILTYANTVNNNKWASQNDVDQATTAIQSAMSELIKRDEVNTKMSVIGKGHYTIDGKIKTAFKLPRNSVVHLASQPGDGYELEAWYNSKGEVVSKSKEFDYTVAQADTIVAKFRQIINVDHVAITYDGKETNNATVSNVAIYTLCSADFSVNVYPSNADSYTVVDYKVVSGSVNLKIDGSKVSPSSNSKAYGMVMVTVKDNKSGKTYTDDISVAFVRNSLKSVSTSPSTMTFDSVKSATQNITPKYTNKLATADIKTGYYVSSNENVAKVTSVNSSGVGTVKPIGAGTCDITFYSYDGAHSAKTTVTVGGKSTASGTIVMMESPEKDTGTIPVENAKITINSKTVTTNSDGKFTFSELTNSTYTANVVYENGINRTITINMDGGDKTNLVIPIVAIDYCNDGFINVKDFIKIKGKSDSEKQIYNNFVSKTKYESTFYSTLKI